MEEDPIHRYRKASKGKLEKPILRNWTARDTIAVNKRNLKQQKIASLGTSGMSMPVLVTLVPGVYKEEQPICTQMYHIAYSHIN
jgi:hypothetical protein